jgi:hypothetical protein
MKTKVILLIPIVLYAHVGFSQGTFQNLNFEAASVAGYTTGSLMPVTQAFPNWQVLYGAVQTSQVYYDGLNLGGPVVSIVDSQNGNGYGPIQGNYSALLFNATPTGSETLSQTGALPYGTTGLQLYANEQSGSFTVTLDGQTISMTPLQAFSGYTEYSGNLSAFSSLWGQETTLSISESAAPGGDSLLLDNIAFTTNTVPEPNPLALTALGGILFGLYRRFASKQR